MPKSLKKWISNNSVVPFYHISGFYKENFEKNEVNIFIKILQKEVIITSFAKNPMGRTFVSSFESIKYPFYGN